MKFLSFETTSFCQKHSLNHNQCIGKCCTTAGVYHVSTNQWNSWYTAAFAVFVFCLPVVTQSENIPIIIAHKVYKVVSKYQHGWTGDWWAITLDFNPWHAYEAMARTNQLRGLYSCSLKKRKNSMYFAYYCPKTSSIIISQGVDP